MDPFAHLALACAAFLAAHLVSSTPLRGALVRSLGERGYRALYSAAAFATLGWMIVAYARAPAEPLWPGLRLVPALAMPFAFVLIVCGLARNPTAVGADRLLKSAEPARGILRVTRHPVMWGILLWAGAHILARGELKATIFFGTMLMLAGLGSVLLDARKAIEASADWQRFAAVTSHIPFVAIAQGRNRLVLAEIGWTKPAIGLALYALVFWAHPWLFGARPY
ncbi:MAG: NnrU family protein [Pseudomonadota bacterium]